MRFGKIIQAEIVILLLYIFIALTFFSGSEDGKLQQLDDCADFSSGWEIAEDIYADSSTHYGTLPSFYQGSDDIYIRRTLENITDNDCIGFFAFQQQVSIYLDGKEVYSFLPSETARSQTPGNKWIFIPLREEFNGQTLTVHIHQCYSRQRTTLPHFYYGTQAGIVLSYMRSVLPSFALSIFTILLGVVLMILYRVYPHKEEIGRQLLYLAMFAFFRGCWTAIEVNIYSFFWSRLLMMSQLSYLCLKMATITYIEFVNVSLHNGNNRLLKGLSIVSIADFWLSLLLQLTGIADFATTVGLTHAVLITGSIFVFGDILTTLFSYHRDKEKELSRDRKNAYLTQIGGTVVILIMSLIDLVRYYCFPSPDVARFSRIGDLLYVLSISFALLSDFMYLIKVGHNAAQIKEESYLDSMTRLRNRARFEYDLSAVSKLLRKNYSIVMLDLNNLKTFNDVYGHDMGDYYIIIASEAIRDYFSPYGTVYRIGGDEFCVIARRLDAEKFLQLRTAIDEHMLALHVPNHDELHMSISCGYARFDSNLDHTLHDTMKRADEEMYENKKAMKEGR